MATAQPLQSCCFRVLTWLLLLVGCSLQSSLLKEHLIGQDDAVEAVCTALMRARAGLRDPDRPIASLLLVGPTGESLSFHSKIQMKSFVTGGLNGLQSCQ
jgi:hypothetical protein